MLRSILILILIAIGGYYAIQSPFYALLFYIGNAYFRPEDWVWFDFVRSLKLSLLSGALVVATSVLTAQRPVWSGKIALLLLFLIHTFFSTLASENFSYSWGYWTDFLKVLTITYLMVVLVDDFAKFRLVLLVMVLALGLEQAKQGWFYLMTSPGWHNANPVAFLGDNNGVAVGMLMLVPMIGLLAQTTQNRHARIFYYFIFTGCLYRALSTYSRGGFLAATAMGGMWFMRTREKLRATCGAIAILAIVVPMLPDTFWARMQTIQTYEEKQDDSALGRLHFWGVAMEMANANPLLGIGFNGYNMSYNAYDPTHSVYGEQRSVHSSFLGVISELGYVGAMIYSLIILGCYRSCSRVRKWARHDARYADLDKSAVALQASLVAFTVGGSFVIFQYNEMLWHLVGLTITLERIAKQQVAVTQIAPDQKNFTRPLAAETHVAA